MNEQLKSLYKTVILQHDKEPFHFEKKEGATYVLKAYNEICGDRFEVFFEIENGKISDIFFHGYGCAISKASTSVLVKKMKNQPLEMAKERIDEFLDNVMPGEKNQASTDEEFTAFSAAKDFPGRLKCATLVWDEMQKFLTGKKDKHEN